MGVTTTKTNKPLNPRGNDQSPLAYNRAKLYSGKALDFDGVNDSVNLDGFTMTGTTATFAFNVNFDAITTNKFVFDLNPVRFVIGLSDITGNPFGLYDNSQWQSFGDLEPNQWHNVIISIDGTSAIMYLNGQSFGNEMTMANAIDFDSATEVAVGSNFSKGGGLLNGQIAGFKIFNTALTAAQVADLYNNPEKVVPTGVDNTALKLWLPMMEGAGTTAYDGSAPLTDYVTNGDFSDGTNNWTASNATLSVEGGALKITSTGGNRPQGYQTITGLIVGRKYLLSAVARVGTTSYNMEIEISGIGASGSYNKTTNSTDTYIYTEFTATSTTHVVQAKIDDSAVGVGETGYFDDIKLLDLGNYGTINGATWVQGVGAPVAQTAVIDWNKWYLDHSNEVLIPQGLTAGRDLLGNLFENVRKQGALNLDGNSWAEVHDNASLDVTTAVTLEAWIYIEDNATQGRILNKWGGSGADRSYQIFMNNALVRFLIGDGTSQNGLNSATSLSVGNWHHIVGTYDSTNIKIYIDGSEDASVAETFALVDSSETLYIGTYYNQTNTSVNPLAQPRIYNRALTAEEVARNYNAGKNTYTNS